MTSDPWPAPTARQPIEAVVSVPGSKSMTNRALVLAALAEGPSTLRRPLESRDTRLMCAALRALGVGVDDTDSQAWIVNGGGRITDQPTQIDVGNAGTVARFLPPVATLATAPIGFDGDPRVRERPLRPLLDALRSLGADIDGDGLPITVTGHGALSGGKIALDASASSQFVSGLLLAAPRFDLGVVVSHDGPRLPSRPHVAMTTEMLRSFGAEVEETQDSWQVAPGALSGCTLDIEPDLSTAAPFLAAAVVTRGRVQVQGWPAHTSQPGALLPAILEEMGAHCALADSGLTVTGTGEIRGIDVNLADAPEAVPVLAAVATLAATPSRFGGVAHLRGQETDRLAALATQLSSLGGRVEETEDGLRIEPAPLHGGRFSTYDDHRLAMAAAVVGLAVEGVLVENAETTGKTFPGFVDAWERMLAG